MPFEFLLPPSLGDMRATARAELLQTWFRRWLGEDVRVTVAPSYTELEGRISRAEVEMAWAPPLVCARVEAKARAILKAVRAGSSTYRAALVARLTRRLDVTAEALSGARAAWVDPLSTAGYLLPIAFLRSKGIDPDRVLGGQSFAGSYRTALRAVITGEADFAPIYTPDASEISAQESLSECVGIDRAQLAPFAYSGDAPNDGLIVTSKLSRGDAESFVRRLTPFALATHGANLLLAVLAADRLERADPGEYSAYETRVA